MDELNIEGLSLESPKDYTAIGRKASPMEMYLEVEGDKDSRIQFPVLPPSFERQKSYNNQQVDVNQKGTINLIGKPGLQSVEISAFFPHEYNSSFCQVGADSLKEPYEYVAAIESFYGKICRFVLTGGYVKDDGSIVNSAGLNMTVLIDAFNYGETDGTRDVSFTLSLSEYVSVELTRKAAPKTTKKTYTTKKKDTLGKIAKKKLGSASKYNVIYNNNVKKCTKAWKKKAYAAKNKKKAKKNKLFVKGIKLVIPK